MGRGANHSGYAATLRGAREIASVHAVTQLPGAGGTPEFEFPETITLTAVQRGKLSGALRSQPAEARLMLLIDAGDGTIRFTLPAWTRAADGELHAARGGEITDRGRITWYRRR